MNYKPHRGKISVEKEITKLTQVPLERNITLLRSSKSDDCFLFYQYEFPTEQLN